MNLAQTFRQVVDNAKSFGTSAALHDIQQRAVNRLVPFQILRGMTAVLNDVDPGLRNAGTFEARFARPDELVAHADPEYGMSEDFVRGALGKGDDCFAI